MADEEGIDFDCEDKVILHIYRTREAFEAASRVSQLLSYGGVDRRAVTPDEMKTIDECKSNRAAQRRCYSHSGDDRSNSLAATARCSDFCGTDSPLGSYSRR